MEDFVTNYGGWAGLIAAVLLTTDRLADALEVWAEKSENTVDDKVVAVLRGISKVIKTLTVKPK